MIQNLQVSMTGHLRINDGDTGEVLCDKYNAIHPQNMSRIISRALSKEANSSFYRIAYGNGGTITDPTGQVIFNPTNDGRDGSWESRLYNETYSEIIDDTDLNLGYDPGSSEPGNIRTGGGSVAEDDPLGAGVVSQEVGTKSNIIITTFINKNEPTGQFATINDFGVEISGAERTFVFDEIGIYSPGKQAVATYGYSSVNVGNKTADDTTLLVASTVYIMNYTVDGVARSTTITTPAAGSGPSGALTYGDLCEGLNVVGGGSWVTSGAVFSDYAYAFITDRSGGVAYPTIANKESYGFLTFQSNTSGVTSTVALSCDSMLVNDLFKVITNNLCANVNVNQITGAAAGVVNDSATPANERERLLTHIVFPPITKTGDKALNIVYTITVTVSQTSDSRTTIV